jgi:C4-dicarboxylate-specific signal transduction histidine kinase
VTRRLIAAHPAALSLALVAVVFGIDLCLPLGVASAVPYTFAVLLALAARPPWLGVAVACLCGVLTVAKLELVPERGTTEMWKVLANRGLALFAIGMTTLLGVLRRRAAADRQRAEERVREHQAALARVGRLSLLGQVAAGLAHELNQPLAAVCLQADVAARLAVPGEPVRAELRTALEEIAEQATRAAAIVRSIRRTAQQTGTRQDLIDLADATREVLRLFDWQARPSGVTLDFRSIGPPATVLGDGTQLEQAMFNLIQNAVEAVAGSVAGPKTVTIETSAKDESATFSVRDSGPGATDPERVFDPFYTTKPDGLGLGLAITRSIVEAHDGNIRVERIEGGGACFSFTLPAVRTEES